MCPPSPLFSLSLYAKYTEMDPVVPPSRKVFQQEFSIEPARSALMCTLVRVRMCEKHMHMACSGRHRKDAVCDARGPCWSSLKSVISPIPQDLLVFEPLTCLDLPICADNDRRFFTPCSCAQGNENWRIIISFRHTSAPNLNRSRTSCH